MVFLWILCTLFIVAAAILTLLLFSAVVVEVDTGSRLVRVRWSFLLAYRQPLPGTKGERQLSIAGFSVLLPQRKRKKSRKKKKVLSAKRSQARRERQRKQVRLLWNCLLDDDIRGALMRRFARLPVGLWEAVELSHCHADISFPDLKYSWSVPYLKVL